MWRYIRIALLVLSLYYAGTAAGIAQLRISFDPVLQVVVNGKEIMQIGKIQDTSKSAGAKKTGKK